MLKNRFSITFLLLAVSVIFISSSCTQRRYGHMNFHRNNVVKVKKQDRKLKVKPEAIATAVNNPCTAAEIAETNSSELLEISDETGNQSLSYRTLSRESKELRSSKKNAIKSFENIRKVKQNLTTKIVSQPSSSTQVLGVVQSEQINALPNQENDGSIRGLIYIILVIIIILLILELIKGILGGALFSLLILVAAIFLLGMFLNWW